MKYDFSGYITKNDIVCSDGRVIRHDAFKDQDGARVPLVYQHMHNDINNVLGFVDMENRSDGVYGYGSFNDTPNAKTAKAMVQHGDLNAMSIYANQLVQSGTNPVNVMHGNIREVSLVLSGANPGATIDQVSLEHSDGSTEIIDEAIIHTGIVNDIMIHADGAAATPSMPTEPVSNPNQNGSQNTNAGTGSGTMLDVWKTFTDDEKNAAISILAGVTGLDFNAVIDNISPFDPPANPQEITDKSELATIYKAMGQDKQTVVNAFVGTLANEIQSGEAEDNTAQPSDNMSQSAIDYEENAMKYNVFDNDNEAMSVVSHDSFNSFLEKSIQQHVTSMKDFADSYEFTDQNGSVLMHDGNRSASLNYGISNIEYLFPDYHALNNEPETIDRDQTWVSDFMNGTTKSPFARLKTTAATLTADEARAKGYITGKKKLNEVISLLKRTTDPQTVYKKQALDRDDVLDIESFDVVVWLKDEMKGKLREEVARAGLIGDGRSDLAEDKISPKHIIPIYGDSDVFTIYQEVTDETLDNQDGIVDLAVRARKHYKGSGSPVLYANSDIISMLMLSRDKMGRRLYQNEADLASAMRVSRIVEVPVLEGITRPADSKTFGLLGIIVNPKDYTFGAVKGGEENFFDDFDIDFNQYKMLIETRTSGMLSKPYSAIAIEYDTAKYTIGAGTLTKVSGSSPSGD